MGKREDILRVRDAAEAVLQCLLRSVPIVAVEKPENKNNDNNNNSSSSNDIISTTTSSIGDNNGTDVSTSNGYVSAAIHPDCYVMWIDPNSNQLLQLQKRQQQPTRNSPTKEAVLYNSNDDDNKTNDIDAATTSLSTTIAMNWKELMGYDVALIQGKDNHGDTETSRITIAKMIRCVSILETSAAVRVTIPFVQKHDCTDGCNTNSPVTVPVSGWMVFLLVTKASPPPENKVEQSSLSSIEQVWQCISVALSIGNSDDGEGPSFVDSRNVRELTWGEIQFLDDDDDDGTDTNDVNEDVNDANNETNKNYQTTTSPKTKKPIGYRVANRTCNGEEMKRVLHPITFRLSEVDAQTGTVQLIDRNRFCGELVTNRYTNPLSDHSKAKQLYENTNSISSSTTTANAVPFDIYASQYDELISGEFATPQIALVTCKIGHPPALWTDFLTCAKVVVPFIGDRVNEDDVVHDDVCGVGVESSAMNTGSTTGCSSNKITTASWTIIQKSSWRQEFPVRK